MSPTRPADCQRQKLVRLLQARAFGDDGEFRAFGTGPGADGQVDYLFAVGDEPHTPQAVFYQVRWGGQFIYIARQWKQVAETAEQFARSGFALVKPPTSLWDHSLPVPVPLPFLSRRFHYFIARKTSLILPGEISERFTYNVHLIEAPRHDDPYVVLKEVPAVDALITRLTKRHPNVPLAIIERRARKFAQKIFPTFLTREAAILKILQRDLPYPYRDRIPRVLDMEQDERGFVQKLYLRWLRNGGTPISQLEFAKQSAELLHALHEKAGVVHLDLRLDNMVVTPRGVGFVDFGSSVRLGENLAENPLLHGLFEELMRTSEIQRMLEHMSLSGMVTSQVIRHSHCKVDPAVDFFYLSLQLNQPHSNPDFRGLVLYDSQGAEAKALANLTQQVLRPQAPADPPYRSAGEILQGIKRIEHELYGREAIAVG